MDYLTTHTSLSPIWHGFAPGFVNYKKGCTRLAAASDKVYQLLAHGQWFSLGTKASSTTKTGRHDIAEILLKVALNTINQSILVISLDLPSGNLCGNSNPLLPNSARDKHPEKISKKILSFTYGSFGLFYKPLYMVYNIM